MGINHTKEIFEASVEWPTPSHKLTSLVMAYSADRKGAVRLTQEELGEQVGLSRQRISAIMDDLCDLEVIKRLGHGRYGLRFGLPAGSDDILPAPKGADKECERLLSIKQPGQGIAYRDDGWPVLDEARPDTAARRRT